MNKPLNYAAFVASIANKTPEDDWPDTMKALWYDAKDDWHAAHDIADGKTDALGTWIHAYLHRKEGDEWNAGYWYRKAGKPFPQTSLEAEHKEIVESILSNW